MAKNNESVAKALLANQAKLSNRVPDSKTVPEFVETSFGLLFPQLASAPATDASVLLQRLNALESCLTRLCGPVVKTEAELTAVTEAFIEALPRFQMLLLQDAAAICQGDPAASSVDEVIVAYPGFFAIGVYRFAHWLYSRKIPIVPRMISEYAHSRTGIEVHPGATIGEHFVIDHGTGIVIGETTVIGDNVKIYQGVTLGALSVDKSLANKKRHPTIERDVVIYANATILGGETIIGAGSVIGGNVWLTESVPPGSRIYHRPS
jgi:serine O-acetyltransferase